VGCLLAALEVHRPGAARLGALLLAGALFYAGVRVLLDTAFLTAYRRGGVAFHFFAILGALLLPVTLLAVARLSGRRWAPVLAVAVAVGLGLAGTQIARAGFAVLQPVSYLTVAIAEDPTSPIALGNEIARKNREAPDPWPLRLALPLVTAAVFAAADGRRRPVAAGAAYAVALLAAYGWYLASRPAFAPLTPAPLETAAALVVAALAGAAGGWLARAVAAALEPDARPAHHGVRPPRPQARSASANIVR
jgi:hypothetical protein